MNVLEKLIRLVVDRRSMQDSERALRTWNDRIDGGLEKIRRRVLQVGAGFAAVLGARALGRFLKDSVKTFGEAEAIWNRLGQAVDNAGVKFDKVEGEIRLAAAAMQDATTVGDEDFAATLTELITITGDYVSSLEAVPVVADLAAAKQIDLRTAAQLVGRAMIGETSTLKRYGIIVEEGADAMEVLRTRFAGFAENEAKTFQGRVVQLTNAWDDFREEVGRVIVTSVDGADAISLLTDKVKDLTGYLSENREEFARGGKFIIDFVVEGFRRLANGIDETVIAIDSLQVKWLQLQNLFRRDDADRLRQIEELKREIEVATLRLENRRRGIVPIEFQPAQPATPSGGAPRGAPKGAPKPGDKDAIADEVKLLEKGFQLRGLTEKEQTRILELEGQTAAALARGNLPLERRVELLERMKTLSELAQGVRAERGAVPTPTAGLESTVGAVQLPIVRALDPKEVERITAGHRRVLEEEFAWMRDAAESTAEQMTAAFETFFDSMIRGFQAGDSAAEAMAKGVIGLGKFIVAQLLEGFAEKEIALGTAALASGIWPPNPAALKSATLHFLAAGLARAVSSAVSGGGRGSGGGSIGGALTATPSRTTTDTPAGELHVYFIGEGFDAVNPRVQDVVQGATQLGREKFGSNMRVYTHRRSA